MSTLLDIIGSFTIGAVVLTLIIRFNQSMITSSQESIIYNTAQLSTTQLSQVIEFDFYKIGYRTGSGEKIAVAKESDIQYYSDYNNDGIIDTLRYFISDTSALSNTMNPDDKLIYRTVNDSLPELVGSVIFFKLTYRDNTGSEITPVSLLADSLERRKISEIDIHLFVESDFPIHGQYQGAEWKKNIVLKNIY
jgi:hypothetical protein